MWKKEDGKSQGVPEISTTPASAPAPSPNATPASSALREPPAPSSALPGGGASISQGIKIKGEVTGSEDLFVDGTVDGKLSLTNGSLTIGPNGVVKADVIAREVIVRGKIDGKVTAREKVALGSTGQVNGEVQTDRLAIEDGAMLRGKVEAGKHPGKNSDAHAAAASAAPASSKSTSALSSSAAN